MPIIVIVLLFLFYGLSYTVGKEDMQKHIHDLCVSKYSNMPHNQVDAYCSKLLKFEKD